MSNIRFYKYYFYGVDKPIIMEAENRAIANQMLVELSHKAKVEINLSSLIDVRVETPIFGISVRKRHGNQYVWVGTDKTSDGWLLQEEFDAIEKLRKQQR